jgi:hypothetical protein
MHLFFHIPSIGLAVDSPVTISPNPFNRIWSSSSSSSILKSVYSVRPGRIEKVKGEVHAHSIIYQVLKSIPASNDTVK